MTAKDEPPTGLMSIRAPGKRPGDSLNRAEAAKALAASRVDRLRGLKSKIDFLNRALTNKRLSRAAKRAMKRERYELKKQIERGDF